ncbi:uncharacterized protein LOC143678688 [Tamandua tetradactyla]|uniref:uncharacterized protein LOC143678688 n=1 Tax=Tamandua tetradactyla TaxID=48850 RepID=UPI004053A350
MRPSGPIKGASTPQMPPVYAQYRSPLETLIPWCPGKMSYQRQEQCKQPCQPPPVFIPKCPEPCPPPKCPEPCPPPKCPEPCPPPSCPPVQCPPQPCQPKCPPVQPYPCQQMCPPKSK